MSSESLIEKFKRNRTVAIIIIISSFITGLALFTDSIEMLYKKFDNWRNEGVQTEKVKKVEKEKEHYTGGEIDIDQDNLEVPSTDSIQRNSPFNNNETNNLDDDDLVLSITEKRAQDFKIFCNSQIRLSEVSDQINFTKDGIIITPNATSHCGTNNNNCQVNYKLNKRGSLLEINPNSPYLRKLSSGQLPSGDYGSYNFGFPALDFKILNQSNETINFTKALFSIRKSVSDNTPYPLLSSTFGYFYLPISNIGFGSAQDVKIDLSFKDKNDTVLNHALTIDEMSGDCTNCSLVSIFEDYGVDVGLITRSYDFNNFPSEAEIENARGIFTGPELLIKGKLSYKGLNPNGIVQNYSFPFEYTLNLTPKVAIMESALFPSGNYNVKFRLDQSNYYQEVNFSHSLESNASDRFVFKLFADQNSKHLFDLTLYYNDNEEIKIEGLALNFHKTNNISLQMEANTNIKGEIEELSDR